jgi:small subunit ribosomal protein S16
MIRIRLSRVGKKGRPSYRIVVAEGKAPRDGSYLEWIGNYDPMANPPAVTLKQDRAAHWLSKGALPSDPVSRILAQHGLWERTQTFKTHGGEGVESGGASAAPVAVATPPQASAPAAESSAEEEPVEATVEEQPAQEAPPGDEEAAG